jgi:hypothetical protein
MQPTHVTIPALGALLGNHRSHAWRRVRAGEFGTPIKIPGRPPVVPVAAVEKATGRKFTAAEIDAAAFASAAKQIARRNAELTQLDLAVSVKPERKTVSTRGRSLS